MYGIYANMTGVYWWQMLPYIAYMDPMGIAWWIFPWLCEKWRKMAVKLCEKWWKNDVTMSNWGKYVQHRRVVSGHRKFEAWASKNCCDWTNFEPRDESFFPKPDQGNVWWRCVDAVSTCFDFVCCWLLLYASILRVPGGGVFQELCMCKTHAHTIV